MRESVKVIKFTAVMSILLMVATYLVSVNIEAHILAWNTVWISNDFAFSLFGGAFASMIVVMICEIQKYITYKASTERYIYYQTCYLYQALFLMQQNILDYLKNIEAEVPPGLLDETTRMIRCQLSALQGTDYTPFSWQNNLLTTHQEFCAKTVIEIEPITHGYNALRIAINKVKMDFLLQNNSNKEVTSIYEPLRTMLSIQFDRCSKALEMVNGYLNIIDKHCKYRYNWIQSREKICSSYVNIFEAWSFEKEFQNKI